VRERAGLCTRDIGIENCIRHYEYLWNWFYVINQTDKFHAMEEKRHLHGSEGRSRPFDAEGKPKNGCLRNQPSKTNRTYINSCIMTSCNQMSHNATWQRSAVDLSVGVRRAASAARAGKINHVLS
jgi:hypothetical protein